MKIKNKLGIKFLGLVVFSLLLAVNCAEKGTDPEANIPPNTFITNFQIDVTPSLGTDYNTRVYWKGNDEDGAVYWYYWRVIGDAEDSVFVESADSNINLSVWQLTPSLSAEFSLEFATFNKKYIFEVMAQDNDRADDPTPAIDTISVSRIRDFNYLPNTEIVTGPPNGALTGQGIYFEIKGTDIDGAVDTIAYMIDTDTVWMYAATDITTGIVAITLRDIPLGARTITFKAFDNFRESDPTPVSVSVIVVDTFEPEIALSVLPNQAFIVPFTEPILEEFIVSITPTVDFYYSAIDSFRVVTSEGEDLVTTELEYTFENLGPDAYWIDVTAYDIGGNSGSTGHIDFNVVELAGGDGVLCVNGDDWATYPEAADMWENGVPWGARDHFKCWDLMGDATAGGDFADSLLGSGTIPAWMIDTTFFDAISWMFNAYSNDDLFWYDADMQAAIMAYLEMGGNVLIAGRFAQLIFEGDASTADFADYCGYTGAVVGVNPASAVAVHDSVSNMTRIGSHSLSDLVTISHDHATQLFEMPDGTPGLGWVVTPNEAGGGGAVCFIGGRNYRWTNADLKGNIDVVLRYFFGIEN